jgi:hypothetical protein
MAVLKFCISVRSVVAAGDVRRFALPEPLPWDAKIKVSLTGQNAALALNAAQFVRQAPENK